MKITIRDPGPPMWFFEDGDIKLHLTFVEGYQSADVDLEQLSLRGLGYLIGSVQGGLVETDVAYSDLMKRLAKLSNPEAPEPAERVLSPEEREMQEKFLSSQARRQARAEAIEMRCKNLANASYKALRSGLAGETNQYIIGMVLKFEKEGKRRKTVLQFLEDKTSRSSTLMYLK
jgi:hypothetical protein